MNPEIVEGKIDPTKPRRVSRGFGLFDKVVIHQKGGGERVLEKVSAGGRIREIVEHGCTGKFYISKHAGMLGIHGVRMADGTSVYHHFNNFELILWIGAVIGVLTLAGSLVGLPDMPLTPLVLGGIFVVALFVVRAGRARAKAQYDAG